MYHLVFPNFPTLFTHSFPMVPPYLQTNIGLETKVPDNGAEVAILDPCRSNGVTTNQANGWILDSSWYRRYLWWNCYQMQSLRNIHLLQQLKINRTPHTSSFDWNVYCWTSIVSISLLAPWKKKQPHHRFLPTFSRRPVNLILRLLQCILEQQGLRISWLHCNLEADQVANLSRRQGGFRRFSSTGEVDGSKKKCWTRVLFLWGRYLKHCNLDLVRSTELQDFSSTKWFQGQVKIWCE